jgi:hypothetical protein
MENENVSLDNLKDFFEERLEYVKQFYSKTTAFYNDVVKSNRNNPDDWNAYLTSRQDLIDKIDLIENNIFDSLEFHEKDASKILDVLRSKELKYVIEIELATRDLIEKVIDMDKVILKRINQYLASSVSTFAEFEANKHNMQKTYLKMPNVSSRFIDKRDE